MRGLDRTEAMLAALAGAVPRLRVDRAAVRRCARRRRARHRRSDAAGRSGKRLPGRLSGGGRGARTGRVIRCAAAGLAHRRAPAAAPAASAISVSVRRTAGERRSPLGRPRARPVRASARQVARQGAGGEARKAPFPMTADRRKRHLKILELISTRAIHTQEDLAEALAAAGLGGDAVLGQPRHRHAALGQGGRRLPPPAAWLPAPRIPTSAGSPRAC